MHENLCLKTYIQHRTQNLWTVNGREWLILKKWLFKVLRILLDKCVQGAERIIAVFKHKKISSLFGWILFWTPPPRCWRQSTNSLVSNSPFDRNGLRPSRYYVTKDRVLVMASEVGVYDTEPENILQKVTRAIISPPAIRQWADCQAVQTGWVGVPISTHSIFINNHTIHIIISGRDQEHPHYVFIDTSSRTFIVTFTSLTHNSS